MKEQNANYIMLDIETAPDVQSAKLIDEITESKLMPDPIVSFADYHKEQVEDELAKLKAKNYKKQETIERYQEEIYNKDYTSEYETYKTKHSEAIQKLALNHPFASIKILNMIVCTNGKRDVYTYNNGDGDIIIERDIINKVCKKLYNLMTGNAGMNTHELVTFNGKHFDIPLLIERAGVCNAHVQFRWLENLTARGDRYGHYDMMEYRSYLNSPVNKLSLSKNLVLRFGKEFAKKDIDFANCTMEQLLKYSQDEILKLEYWYRVHSGLSVEDKETFLKSITAKDDVEIPDI